MIRKSNCKKILTVLTFLIIPNIFYAQNFSLDYFGIVSKDIDQNMAKMTSDLYFTQLNELSNITVIDKRDGVLLETAPQTIGFSQSNLSFYTEIKKSNDSEKWVTTIYLFTPVKNEYHSITKEYDSFYKILMESKNNLKETIQQLLNNTPENKIDSAFNKEIASGNKITSTENLSGTWSGEDFIDKIVILRGGRGFVIFNNGASMNISVKLDNSTTENNIIITQNGRSNASFYPNLPRQVALNAALEAEPLEWKLTFLDNNTLVGLKKSIEQKNDSYEYNTKKVTWSRIN